MIWKSSEGAGRASAKRRRGTPLRTRAKRMAGSDRRDQILRVATTEFVEKGLHETTTQTLAGAAGVTEPVLYAHFKSKAGLFGAVVQANIEDRLTLLALRLSAIPAVSLKQCVEHMAQQTVAVCVCVTTNTRLTNWGLMETPHQVINLYREEVGEVSSLWRSELERRFPHSPAVAALTIHLGTFPVNVCMAYGFWLATLRHTEESATPLARHFAQGIAQVASTILANEG